MKGLRWISGDEGYVEDVQRKPIVHRGVLERHRIPQELLIEVGA